MISTEQLIKKAAAYCARQERCKSDVIKRLEKHQPEPVQIAQVLEWLVQNNFLNEDRFVEAYVVGKFNNNHWGRIKIKYALLQKHLGETQIENALTIIDKKAYSEKLLLLAKTKWFNNKQHAILAKKAAVARYLTAKGYEFEHINNTLDYIIQNYA